jgi:hypothetical protein
VLGRSAIVSGRVVDRAGAPVAGARVARARNGEQNRAMVFAGREPDDAADDDSVSTADDGTFELPHAEPGAFSLFVNHPPLVVHATAKGFAGGATAPVEVAAGAARDGVDIALTAGGSIRVRIAGEGQAFVTATFAGPDAANTRVPSKMTDAQEVVFEDLRPGPWRVLVRPLDGGEPGTREPVLVEVVAGQTTAVQR